eukprot:1193364-Prorocentrum_minimum.AAC.6
MTVGTSGILGFEQLEVTEQQNSLTVTTRIRSGEWLVIDAESHRVGSDVVKESTLASLFAYNLRPREVFAAFDAFYQRCEVDREREYDISAKRVDTQPDKATKMEAGCAHASPVERSGRVESESSCANWWKPRCALHVASNRSKRTRHGLHAWVRSRQGTTASDPWLLQSLRMFITSSNALLSKTTYASKTYPLTLVWVCLQMACRGVCHRQGIPHDDAGTVKVKRVKFKTRPIPGS